MMILAALSGSISGGVVWFLAHYLIRRLPDTEEYQPIHPNSNAGNWRNFGGLSLTATAGALLMAMTYQQFGWSMNFFFHAFFLISLLLVVIIDVYCQLILNSVLLFILIFGLAFNSLFEVISWPDAINGGIAGGLSMFIIAWMGSRYYGRQAMGMGDVKLMAVAGIFLGLEFTLFAIILTFWVALIFAVPYLLRRRKNFLLPLAPAMATTFTMMILFGGDISRFYWTVLIGP